MADDTTFIILFIFTVCVKTTNILICPPPKDQGDFKKYALQKYFHKEEKIPSHRLEENICNRTLSDKGLLSKNKQVTLKTQH